MTWPKPMPIVEVEWDDSVRHEGWLGAESLTNSSKKRDGMSCRTAGYLFSQDEKDICISLSQSDSGNYCDVMQIPKHAVQSIKVVRKAMSSSAAKKRKSCVPS